MRKVLSVYSGKIGKCMCGCSGKHTYNPELRELGSKTRGYEVSEDECNARTVKMITQKVYRSPNAVFDNGCAYVDIGNRSYVIHFAEG
jgi:hypothetical protein